MTGSLAQCFSVALYLAVFVLFNEHTESKHFYECGAVSAVCSLGSLGVPADIKELSPNLSGPVFGYLHGPG